MALNYPLKPRRLAIILQIIVLFSLVNTACFNRTSLQVSSQVSDTDQDGVKDKLDNCPDTPAGMKVDKQGCPLDIDGDGVPDNMDKCPDVSGPLSNDGCPLLLNENLPDSKKRELLEKQEATEENRRQVTVFFCTNRKIRSQTPTLEFDKVPGPLTYGFSRISIPRNHKMGEIELPISILGYSIEKPNPDKHMVFLSKKLASSKEALAMINRKVAESSRKDAFIFVHGYNNSMDDALLRTAQFTYDLGFEGAPVLFSWPSQDATPEYEEDEKMNKVSITPFKNFLRHFLQNTQATNIYLIAHSMGNRIMVSALKDLMVAEPELFQKKNIREIVLTAPDIGAKEFKRDIIPVIKKGKTNITLYASSDDNALLASSVINREPRAGQAGKNLLIIKGMETIDATGVSTDFLSHSYFATSRTVVSDLHYLYREKLRATSRHWLVLVDNRYWKFKVPLD